MDLVGPQERVWAWMNLVQAHAVVSRAIDDALVRACELSRPHVETLVRLSQNPQGRLRMLDLAHLMLVSKSEVTRLVDRLEQLGHLRREFSPSDRRVTYAVITDTGRAVVDRARPVFRQVLEESFTRHLEDADVQALLRALRNVLEGNREWDETRCCPPWQPETPAATAEQ